LAAAAGEAGMSTFSVLAAKIADDLARSDLTDQINAAILEAIRFYEGERFSFNEANNRTVTLSSSVTYIEFSALPERFIEIDRVRLALGSGSYYDLEQRSYVDLMYGQDAQATGQPIEWGIYADRLQFDTEANQNYTLVLDGLKSLGNTASNTYTVSSSVSWFTAGQDLIRAAAKRSVYAHVIKDMEQAVIASQAEALALNMLKGKASQRGAGYVVPTCW